MTLAQTGLHVLSMMDSESDTKSVKDELLHLGYKAILKQVSSRKELEQELKLRDWCVVFTEHHVGKCSAFDVLKTVHHFHSDLPVVLISAGIGGEAVADLMRAGIEDVVMKNHLERLNPVIKRILREHEIKKRAHEVQKLASEALEAKAQMLAVVSHDIKNPLSAIQLEAQMLLRAADKSGKSPLADEVVIQSNRILKTTLRLKSLIGDLLDRNKGEHGLSSLRKKSIDPQILFSDVVDACGPVLDEKDITVKVSLPSELPSLYLDRNKMFQVLSNLLNNAIKFTSSGGRIEMRLEETDASFIFSVSDSGPGLRENDIPKVFEKYWTGKISGNSGTGLGLYICKTIIEAHGGHIKVENLSNEKGAKFWFSLPKPFTRELRLLKTEESLLGKKILVIDDDDDLREVISWVLTKEGYSVETLRDPSDALKSLNDKNVPHLIIVDYHMDSMKGGEFLTQKGHNISKDVQDCPVLMVSASPEEVQEDVDPSLYQEIISKPLDLQALIENVKRYVS